MSKSVTFPRPGDTQQIERAQWIPFLTEFTREYRGAHARLDVLGEGVGYQVETENRPFDGVAADVKDGEHAVWITFGSKPEDHLAHGIHSVTAIQVLLPTTSRLGAVLEVEARDGSKTVLELTRPEDY